ncbi:MAG: Gfo/Idh/MocA family oxidoreductase, partial [Planctomycetota bacterium]|nr:Gfo/Idh/MocA family oxidoreductase [Planctomycetota bacterium]
MSRINRRGFLKGTLGTAAAISLPSIAVDGAILGANERLRMAVCGLNGRGGSHIGGFGGDKRVELAWLVDPDENVLKRRLRGRKNCQGSANFRKALADKNVDAISVAAPNHWHSLMTIEAAQAGKHCYVEKPASHDVYEGAVATAAWKKYK